MRLPMKLLATVAAMALSASLAQAQAPIKIGSVLSVTGGASFLGDPEKKTLEMYVADINAKLRKQKIFGGKDLSKEIPQLGQSALYCVTEVHSADDIERLVSAIEQAVKS